MSGKRKTEGSVVVEEQPALGGSYVRRGDGSLTLVEATGHSDGPAPVEEEAAAEPAPPVPLTAPVTPAAPQQEG